MKQFFTLALLLTCSFFAYCMEKGTEKSSLYKSDFKLTIICPEKFISLIDQRSKGLIQVKEIGHFLNKKKIQTYDNFHSNYEIQPKSKSCIAEHFFTIMAFVRTLDNKEFYLHLNGCPIFTEKDQKEVLEEIVVHIADNETFEEKSVCVTREERKTDYKAICVERMVCNWDKERVVTIPNVGLLANKYNSEIIPTNVTFAIIGTPTYKK